MVKRRHGINETAIGIRGHAEIISERDVIPVGAVGKPLDLLQQQDIAPQRQEHAHHRLFAPAQTHRLKIGPIPHFFSNPPDVFAAFRRNPCVFLVVQHHGNNRLMHPGSLRNVLQSHAHK